MMAVFRNPTVKLTPYKSKSYETIPLVTVNKVEGGHHISNTPLKKGHVFFSRNTKSGTKHKLSVLAEMSKVLPRLGPE